MELEEGPTILDTGGHSYQVLEALGEGGQGEVYKVEEGGERFALKIYKETMSPNFLYNLKNNIEKGAETLKHLAEVIDTDKMKAPAFLMVLTGVGQYAYRRPDGVFVIPIGCLKD